MDSYVQVFFREGVKANPSHQILQNLVFSYSSKCFYLAHVCLKCQLGSLHQMNGGGKIVSTLFL